MPKYEVTLDGRTFELTGDHEPTEAEARQATGLTLSKDGINADSTAGEVASAAFKNVPSDLYNLGAGVVEAISSPVKTMEGIIDLGSSGMSKLVDELGLAKYADPQKMEKYRKYRGLIADEVSELATEGGLKKRIAEKPVTSLLDLSVVGRGVSMPLRAQQYSSALQKVGDVTNKVSSAIDPTQLVTKPSSIAFDKVKSIADTKKAQLADVDSKLSKFTDDGFVIPPSESKQAGIIKRASEFLLGDGTKGKAISTNQKVFDKKARKFVDSDIPETTPLTKLVDFVSDKYKSTYKAIESYKPVVLQKSKTTKGTTKRDTGLLDADGKPIIEDVPTSSKTKTVYSRSGAEMLKDIRKIRLDYANAWKAARKKADRDGQPINYKNINKEKIKLDQAEAELDFIAKKYGDKNIIDSLKEAKQSYARAFNVESSVKKGSLDAVDFYKKNTRNKAPVDGEGKKIMDFVEEYGGLSKPANKSGILTLPRTLEAGKYVGAGLYGGPLGVGALYAAERGIPNLLLGKKSQKALSSGNYMPTGSGLLNALGSRSGVGASAFIPSLLQTTDTENLKYKDKINPYK